MQHIFLGAHLDDAVCSCGGTIAKLVYEREDVLVITVYTRDPDIKSLPKKFHKFADYDLRKKEDQIALDKLSADYKWLDIEERAYRTPLLKRPTDVFKINLSEGLNQFLNIAEIQSELDRIFVKNPKAKIYAPLGVGNHFDHVEVFLASLMFMVDNALFDNFLFYLDSYGMFSTKMRKKHYLGKKLVSLGTKKPEKSSFKWFMITTVMNSMISGNAIEKLLPSKYLDIEWELETNSIKGYEKLKLSALECYESQVKLFGTKTLEKFFIRHHSNWDSSELFLHAKVI
ncbi:MAG: PIG-L family deacetylase [Candidatus Heimdallarchaeota archaeon]|nr:PIG-L family deacetylase [Candidatus Heimdallarchaeota archaeon]MCK4612609.1 PIG-L family deacetylase [Candidatus Heimdallarchaeota archaeon]